MLPGLCVWDQLSSLGEIPGTHVVHTFQAQFVYFLETIQWSCGVPIGWRKCYKFKSLPQVLNILDRIFKGNDALCLSFIAYDDACDLLYHIITQNSHNMWIRTTRFIVNSWHYIGHWATDVLHCLWCNPVPTNGQQPDLVLTMTDDNVQQYTTHAFNLETAEQLNAWLNVFESQLRQMSILILTSICISWCYYLRRIQRRRLKKKGLQLCNDFWEK